MLTDIILEVKISILLIVSKKNIISEKYSVVRNASDRLKKKLYKVSFEMCSKEIIRGLIIIIFASH